MARLPTPVADLCRKLAQTARLACGVPDYDAYVQHMRSHHPQDSVLSYEQFFADRLRARYRRGQSRCC